MSKKDKLENDTPHFGNTFLYAVADLKRYSTIVVDPLNYECFNGAVTGIAGNVMPFLSHFKRYGL